VNTRSAARTLVALAALAALASPLSTAAQTKRTSRPAAAPPQPTAARPRAPASLDVPLPPPPTARAAPVEALPAPGRAARTGWLAFAGGPFAAFDRGRSAALSVDYGWVATPASWRRLELEWHLAVFVSRPEAETPLVRHELALVGGTPTTIAVPSGEETSRALVVEVLPTARLRRTVVAGLGLFADAGVGVVQTVERHERDETYVGRSKTTRNVTAPVLRVGAGLALDLSDRVRLSFVPFALSLQLGADWSAFAPTVGLAFRL
jgi:hypothetical protein